jgi:superfamily II DNA/RNA helicase
VPQKKRAEIVARFQSDPKTRFFLSTNAGSTGLNLQAANTVINVDLPWNPAVLEQRIGRAYRMGQSRNVSVFILVTEGTLEENLLAALSAKRDLALAALDVDSQVAEVDVRTGAEDLKRRLEVLLGAKPDAPEDRVTQARTNSEQNAPLADASRTLVRAVVSFLAQLGQASPERESRLGALLDAKVHAGEDGRARLSLALPSEDQVEAFAQGFIGLLSGLSNRGSPALAPTEVEHAAAAN